LTVSTADDQVAVRDHTSALTLSQAELDNLVEFILQIDRQSAPEDDEVNNSGGGSIGTFLLASLILLSQFRRRKQAKTCHS